MRRRHDREFEAFVRARHRDWLRLAYLLMGDPHRAQDLLQHVLAGAYVAWPRITDPDHYVRRALANGRRSWWRRRGRDDLPTAALPELPAPGDRHAEVDARGAMWQALGALPTRQRAVLVLRYYEDCSDEEIARVLGTSRATVRSQAHRGLKTLAVRLGLDGRPGGAGPTMPPPVHDGDRRMSVAPKDTIGRHKETWNA